MINDTGRLSDLLTKFVSDKASEQEVRELFTLLKDSNDESPVKQQAVRLWNEFHKDESLAHTDWEKMYAAIVATPVIGHRTPKRKSIFKIAVAAAVIFLVGIGIYFYVKPTPGKELAGPTIPAKPDIAAPQTNLAMITLANGQKLYLDSAGNGELAMQDNIKLLRRTSGEIVYETTPGQTSAAIKYNTLENPRGSNVISMALADGSKVWLNAGSSLTYPVAFIGNERKVSITGEAYFEVSPLPTSPGGGGEKKTFIVSKGDMEVTVLGTHFNVNAYDDETDIKVTLLEGSVAVSRESGVGSREKVFIKPGEQAILSFGRLRTGSAQNDKEIKVLNNVDVEAVMAWKNGVFKFNNTNIREIMRQVERWYDVQISYEGNFADLNFGGNVSRKANVSALLKRLEATEAVRFTIEGRKIIVRK